MKSRLNRRATVGGLTFTLVVIAVLTATVLLAQGGDESVPIESGDASYPMTAAEWLGGPLLTKNRTTLSVCVSPAFGAKIPSENALARIEDVLATASSEGKLRSFAEIARDVKAGCPKGPGMHFEKGVDSNDGVNMTIVERPSDVRLMVFVVPQQLIDTFAGAWTDRTVAEEVLCSGPQDCGEVTTGLYLGEDEMTDSTFLQSEILDALGQ